MKFEPVNLPGHEGRLGYYMSVFTGGRYFPCDPRVSEIHIADIAHGLANQCRFNGQTRRFYSVAEHSVLASYIVPMEDRFEALMHDAAEAYVGDMIRPLKMIPELRKPFTAIEELNEIAIAERYELRFPRPKSVKVADEAMVTLEMRENLTGDAGDHLHDNSNVAAITLKYWSPDDAELVFLERFYGLCPDRLW
jgi:hypothetical protein